MEMMLQNIIVYNMWHDTASVYMTFNGKKPGAWNITDV